MSDKANLTPKQQEILDYITKKTEEQGYNPSVREICEAVGLSSPSTVHGYITRMKAMGILKSAPHKNRSVTVASPKKKAEASDNFMEVPVIGNVAAGTPILAEENVQRTFPLPMDFAHNKDVFMLKVRGESMINAGILNGDYVIVSKQPSVSNGEIAVAMIDGEATVKTFYNEKTHIRLQPENDYMEPIITTEAVILGKVIGVYRML